MRPQIIHIRFESSVSNTHIFKLYMHLIYVYIQFHKSENSYLIYHLWNGTEWFSRSVVREVSPTSTCTGVHCRWGSWVPGPWPLAGCELTATSESPCAWGLRCQWVDPWPALRCQALSPGVHRAPWVWRLCPSHAVFLYEFSIGYRPHLRATSRLPAFETSTVKCHFVQRCVTLIIYPSKNN